MPTTLHEFAGVIISVDCTPADANCPYPTLTSARVLGADYTPCGPDLLELLDIVMVPTQLDTLGNVVMLTPLLSVVTKEIENARHATTH